MNSHFCPPAIQSGSQRPIMGYYKCCQVFGLVCPTSVNRRVHWLCRAFPLSISFRRETLFISPCSSGALTAMPAAAWLFKLGPTQHGARSRVWIFGALFAHACTVGSGWGRLGVTCISATMLSSGFMWTVKASRISRSPSYRTSISTECCSSPALNSTSDTRRQTD